MKSGELKAIGVTSKTRSGLMPEVATIREQGVNDFVVVNWTGLYAPKDTPQPIIDYLAKRLQGVVADPVFKELLKTFATVPVFPDRASSDALASCLEEQTHTWGAIIKQAGIKGK